MKVLLVDDDLDELEITAFVLRRDGFAVVEASDEAQALTRFRLEQPDVVVLSFELRPSGGVEVLRHVRAENQTPVLVTIGHNDSKDVFHCFELGADDFITRPYVCQELALRIRAIFRRATSSVRQEPDVLLELGDLRFDPETHNVARGLFEIRLTPTESRIFYTLAKSAEHVVPAYRLLTLVRGRQGGAANSLRSHICHLRKKLALEGGSRGSIASVPAVGYVFRAPVAHDIDVPNGLVLGQVVAGS